MGGGICKILSAHKLLPVRDLVIACSREFIQMGSPVVYGLSIYSLTTKRMQSINEYNSANITDNQEIPYVLSLKYREGILYCRVPPP